MDTNVLLLIGFTVALIFVYITLFPEGKISSGVGSVASGLGDVAGAAGAAAGGAKRLGQNLFDKCPDGFKKFAGSRCRIKRPIKKVKKLNSACPSGYSKNKNRSKNCYQDCTDVHPWTVNGSEKKFCVLDVRNSELREARDNGISVNQLMVNKGYPALSTIKYGDYEESFLY